VSKALLIIKSLDVLKQLPLNGLLMETKEIAQKLVAFCQKADWAGAHNTLYAPDASSLEPYSTPEFEKETKGLDDIRKKSRKFDSMVEQIHGIETSEPLVAGNSIAFTLAMDITMKGQGRMKAPELCVYQVKDGKIVSEQFFV
jgi:hypothetical protein